MDAAAVEANRGAYGTTNRGRYGVGWGNGVLECWSVGVVRCRQPGSNLPLLYHPITPLLRSSITPTLHHPISPILRSHTFLERSGGQGEAEVIAHVGDAIGARRVEIAKGALGFDDERCGLGTHHFAVTLRIADVDQHLGVAWQVDIAA